MENFSNSATQIFLAPKRLRWAASVIDYLIYFSLFYIIAMLFGTATFTDGGFEVKVTGFPALMCFTLWFILFPFIEGKNGQTIGKMILGIKVIKEDGLPVFFRHALGRHFFDLVDFFPFLGILGLIVAANN